MKITLLLTQDLDSPSGLGRYYPLARELAALGHQVGIYALHSNFKDLQQKSFEQGNLQVHYVAQMHVLKQGSQKIYFGVFGLMMVVAKATLALTLAALRERPDILWAGKPHPMNGIAWLIGRFRWGCRLLLDCDDDEAGSGNFSAGWQRRLVGWFERQLPKAADLVTTNTYYTRDILQRLGIAPSKIYYLSNGVDDARFSKEPDHDEIESLRSFYGLQGKKVIGYVGSLSLANHAVDLLIAAFEIISLKIPNARLLLVGGGEDYLELVSTATAKKMDNLVYFAGRISPDKVLVYYRLMNVCADPVQDNNAARGRSPLKLFEAWLNGIPIVTSEVGDRGLLATAESGALFVSPGSAEDLANGLIAVIQDDGLSRRLIARGTELSKQYTWRHLAKELDLSLFFSAG